jgi:hypothetical protein
MYCHADAQNGYDKELWAEAIKLTEIRVFVATVRSDPARSLQTFFMILEVCNSFSLIQTLSLPKRIINPVFHLLTQVSNLPVGKHYPGVPDIPGNTIHFPSKERNIMP